MQDLKIPFFRWQLLVFNFVCLSIGATVLTAGEAKPLRLICPQPLIKPIKPSNSTFRTDHSLSSPLARDLSQEKIRQQLIVKAFRARWFQEHLALPQSAPVTPATTAPSSAHDAANDPTNNSQRMKPSDDMRFQWKPALSQAALFLWIEHGFRFATEPGTRAELRGPFFKDWINSVQRTRGWRDGDPFIVNYVGHPMQGSVTNYIFVHNDPKSLQVETGFNKAYVKSRLKAMLFSTVYSTQFELGPFGEAALGNVGLAPTKTARHPSAFVDLVITPTLGTVWTIGEDALDRLVVQRLEDHVENRFVRLMVRGFLTPSRSFANVLRGRYPWHRDGRRL